MWQSWPSYLCMVCMAQSLDFTGPYSQSCKRKKNVILTSLKKLSVSAAMVVWNRTGSAIPGQQLKNWLYLTLPLPLKICLHKVLLGGGCNSDLLFIVTIGIGKRIHLRVFGKSKLFCRHLNMYTCSVYNT